MKIYLRMVSTGSNDRLTCLRLCLKEGFETFNISVANSSRDVTVNTHIKETAFKKL